MPDDSVRVSISASTSGFDAPVQRATLSAKDFADALRAAGNDLKKVDTDALGLSGVDKLAAAISAATASARAAQVTFQEFQGVTLGLGTSFKSAADSAEVFTKALNPTPLQALRTLMGDEMPAAFRLTQSGTQGIIEGLFGLNSGFKSAEESARTFIQTLNPTPLQSLRDLMAGELPSAMGVTQTATAEVIAAVNSIGVGFKSAADSADVFAREISRIPLAQLRRALNDEVAPAAARTAVDFQAVINASTGVDRSFKSAADSAAAFNRALDPTPLQRIRTLMGEELPPAIQRAGNETKATIETAVGLGREFKSAADSADVFTREIERIPLAELRNRLRDVQESGQATFASLQQNIDAANRVGASFKSAADSARVFQQALDPSPLQRMRELMNDDAPQEHARAGVSRLTREFVVLGHEAVTGNWTRIPGTMITLAEYSGGVINKLAEMAQSFTLMQGVGVGAVLAVAGAFVTLIVRAHEAKVAIDEARNAATMGGRSPDAAQAEVLRFADGMKQVGVASRSAALEMSAAISKANELTDAQKAQAAGFGTQWLLNWGNDAKKAGEQFDHIFASTSSLKSYLDQEHLLSTEQMQGWANATTAAQKYQIGLDAIRDRIGPMTADLKKAADQATFNRAQAMTGVMGGPMPMEGGGDLLGPRRLGDFQPGTLRPDPQAEADRQAVIDGNVHLREKQKLEAELAAQQRDLARAQADGNAQEALSAQNAITNTQNQLELWKAAGDASWASRQQAALDQVLAKVRVNAGTSKQLAEDENRTIAAFWEKRAQEEGLTEGQVLAAQQKASEARKRLAHEELADREAGMASWLSKQEAMLSDRLVEISANATSSKTLAADENRERIKFWDELAAHSDLTEKQINAVHNFAARAREQLAAEELRTREAGEATWMASQQARLGEQLTALAAHASSSKKLAEDENRTRIAFWHTAAQEAGLTGKQITAAQAEETHARLLLAMQELRGGESAAKQALQAKLAELSERQALYHDDYTKVMAIEQQKIALLRAAGAEETKALEQELIKQDNLRRQHAEQQAQIAEGWLNTEIRADRYATEEVKAELQKQVTAHEISKSQELNALRAFNAQVHATELEAMNATLLTLNQGTVAYERMLDKIRDAKAQWAAEDARLNEQAMADMERRWQQATAPITGAIEGQVRALLQGTVTMQQAVARMAGNIIISYAEMGIKTAMTWLGHKAMEVLWTGTTEAQKTGVTAAGTAARNALTLSETAAQNTGLIARLARWIATELGFTAATTTGAGERTIALTGEQVATIAAQGAAAHAEIGTAAAIAGSYAFADSAMLGPVGLAAAPEAGAAAYIAASAYHLAVPALAVGAWDLPKDMRADLHAGEMVVPANFASGLRGALSGIGGGGSNTQTINYAPKISQGSGDIASVLRAQSAAFKDYLWHQTRNGALTLPGR